MSIKIYKSKIFNCFILKKKKFTDLRGNFIKIYSRNIFKKLKINNIIQINYSYSKTRGTIRGMHYQIKKYKEKKIISCLDGKIYDVIIDLRKKSPTFLKWQGFILSDKNNKSIIVPEGCAHGFQTLENNTRIIYCHTNIYKKKYEKTVSPFDSRFNIKWPAKLTRISQKDKTA